MYRHDRVGVLRRSCALAILIGAAGALLQGARALSMAAGWSLNEPAQFDAAPGIATTTFDTSNLTAISYNFEHHGITALYPLQWVQTRAEPCFAPIKRMRGNFSCVEVAPNVEQLWKTQFAMLQPYIAAGSVVGIFLGDEHIYFGLNFSDTVMITALIKRDWPTAVIYQNEAPDVLMCGFNKLNETVLTDTDCLPSQLDLLSFDFYDTSFFGSTWESAQLAIERMVIPRLVNPSQQLVHVTTGYAQGPGVNITEFDHFCARNARQWLQYALSQPRLAGIFPFDWVSSGTIIGLEDLPNCLATFEAIGRIVTASGAGGTNVTSRGATVSAGAATSTAAPPKCQVTLQPPPEWFWCGRE